MAVMASEIIGKLMDEFKTVAKTETVLGQEIKVGEFTLIPVSKISLGVGAGGGKGSGKQKEDEGGGGGGGVCIAPVAFIVIKGGEISFHVVKEGETHEGFFEHIPGLTGKILSKVQEAKGKGKSAEPEAG